MNIKKGGTLKQKTLLFEDKNMRSMIIFEECKKWRVFHLNCTMILRITKNSRKYHFRGKKRGRVSYKKILRTSKETKTKWGGTFVIHNNIEKNRKFLQRTYFR